MKKKARNKGIYREVDFSKLIPELLKTIRGKRTQGQVNQRMGFSYPQVYRWESGRKTLNYEEFYEFCVACKKEDALKQAIRNGIGYTEDMRDGGALLKVVCEEMQLSEALKILGCTRFQYSRWLSGKTKLSLEDLLKAVFLIRRSLVFFLEHLMDVTKLPSIKEFVKERNVLLQVNFERPISSAIIAALGSAQYKSLKHHSSELLSQLVGADRSEVDEVVAMLSQSGMIFLHDRKYVLTPGRVETVGGRDHRLQFQEYWLKRAVRKIQQEKGLKAGAARSQLALRFVNMSERRYQHILKNASKLSEVFHTLMTEKIPDDDPSETQRTFVFHLHLINLSGREDLF